MGPRTAEPTEAEAYIKIAGLTQAQIDRARRVQDRMEQPLALGTVLVELKLITRQQLDEVHRDQRSRLSLIELLAEDGHLSEEAAAAYTRARQQNPGASDHELLVAGMIVSEEKFLRAFSFKHDIPYTEPNVREVAASLLEKASLRYLVRQQALPVRLENGQLIAIVSRPMDSALLLELERMFGHPVQPHCCTGEKIVEALQTLERLRSGKGVSRETSLQYRVIEDTSEKIDAGDEAVQIVDYLLARAIQMKASDLHIEPLQESLRVRVRVDGALQQISELPKDQISRITSRIKVLAGCDIAERRLHQDGKIMVRAEGGDVDIRVSTYASIHGETIVLRILDRNRGLLPLAAMGFNPQVLSLIEDVILPSSSGLILMTGPTGSGKTTTLHSFIEHCRDPTEKIITAEDPVEFVSAGAIQCSINAKTGPTFADSLRAMLRQDPDTIVVGEMRDHLTASLAFEAALTGHKVFSTFHTEDAVTVVLRLLEMGLEPFLVSSTLSAIFAQRLVRKLCPACKEPGRPQRKELRFLGLERASLELCPFQVPVGCPACADSGYKSRLCIYEVLVPDDDLRDAILVRSSTKELRAIARRTPPFMTLQEDALLKAVAGTTSLAEIVSSVPRDPNCRPVPELRELASPRRQR